MKKKLVGMILVAIMVLAIVPFAALSVLADEKYTVTLYANDGQGTQKQISVSAGLYVLPECEFTPPPEMTFKAWAIGSQSGEQKQPGAAINITEDTLIVAIWTESAAMYETRPNGGVTSVGGSFDIRYRLEIQPDSIWLEFYNDYQGKWSNNYCLAAMPEYEGALTHFTVPAIHKDTEETILFRLVAYKEGIAYYSNEFTVKFTNNRFTEQPESAILSPGEEYNASYSMSFTPSSVTVEYKDGGEWKHYSNADADGVTLDAGDGEKTILFRIRAIKDGDAYYSHEFTVRWCDVVEVSTWEELLSAVNSDRTYIKLTANIKDVVPYYETPENHRLKFIDGKDYVLDLNGYTLEVLNHTKNEYYSAEIPMIKVSGGSSLEIMDGKLAFDNWSAKNNRKARGVVHVEDTSTLVATHVNMQNCYSGTVISATDDSRITVDGGEYTVQNGFAIYLDRQASLTLGGDVYIHTVVGDSANTQYVDGYGALYSESTGELVIHNAFFKSGIQVNSSQIGAFSTATHELTINGKVMTEDIFVGTSTEAKNQNKEYFWYSYNQNALENVQNNSFVNTVKVISYEKKYPIEVMNGTATVNGAPVTEAGYGQTVTVVADAPEEGKEFSYWSVVGGGVDYPYYATSTFTMPANPITITACYGNAAISEVDITITPPEGGETPSMAATANNNAVFVMLEWYVATHGSKCEENDIFYPGFSYEVNILLNPEDGYKFADTVTARVNGMDAQIMHGNEGYVLVKYEFDALPENPFNVTYKAGYQNGLKGLIELNVDGMKASSSIFSTALDAGKVSYQWYRDGKAIAGATDSAYTFGKDDVGSYVYCVVTADETVAYGYTVMCTGDLYKVDFNLTEIVPGGRAPELTSVTDGVVINASSYVICEKYSDISFGSNLNTEQAILIPGRSYRIVAFYVLTDPESISIGENATFYVNGNLADKDGWRILYDFTVPAVDFEVNVTSEHEIGIGAELVADEIQGAMYQWYRNGEAIVGATSRSYIVAPEDKASLIHCVATKGDGSYGYSSQYIIAHYITVIRINGPVPKGSMNVGKATSAEFSANAATVKVMWWLGTADDIANNGSQNSVDLENDYIFIEGTNYALFAAIVAKDTYALHYNAVAYYNNTQGLNYNQSMFVFDVVAIHAHVYGDEYNAYDEYGHWKRCTVPGCPNPDEEWEMYTEHAGGTATCHTKGTCTQCGAEYYADHDFSVPDYRYVDDTKCANFCANCDVWGDWSYHEGGTADCQNKAVCEICHHEYGDLGEHSAKAEWLSDGESHWHECSLCDGQQLDKAAHSGGTATCTEEAICSVCNTAYGNTLEHNYGSEWQKNADEHWNECVCTDKANKAAHADSNNDGKCDTCDYAMPAHDPETPPADNPPSDDEGGLGTGAVIGIVCGSVAVVSVGGFSLLWFVIKKKSFADLIAVFKKK